MARPRSYIDRRIALALVSAFGLELFPRNEGRGGGFDIVLGQRCLARVARYSDVEEWLETNGYIVDDEPAAVVH